jgi:hypothetical protein
VNDVKIAGNISHERGFEDEGEWARPVDCVRPSDHQ